MIIIIRITIYLKRQPHINNFLFIIFCSLQDIGGQSPRLLGGSPPPKGRFGRGKHTSINAYNVALPIFQTISGPEIPVFYTIFYKRVAIKLDWPTSRH